MYNLVIVSGFAIPALPDNGVILVQDNFTGYTELFERLIFSDWKMAGVDRGGDVPGTIWVKF